MNILGISGIDGTMDFKRRHWPGLEEREYRISQGHDSAAALVVDGEFVVGVAEERINRRKHTGVFPRGAIEACLRHAGLRPGDLDAVVHSFDYAPYGPAYRLNPTSAELYRDVLAPAVFTGRVREALPEVRADHVQHVDHHLAHAASALYTSGWEDCMVVVVDGMGEAYSTTVYRATDGKIEPVHRIAAANSIGVLYSVVTLHLGFDFNSDEYKVMGLAPYGDPERHREFFAAAVRLRPDGGWEIPLLQHDRTAQERQTHRGVRRHLAEHLIPGREPEGPIGDEHADVAAALQQGLDRAMLHLCSHFGASLGARRLALAGGVALNTTANARLLESGRFDEIYVQPAAADDGSALGAALWRSAVVGEIVNRRSPTPFYGPAPAAAELDAAARANADRVVIEPLATLEEACAAAAELLEAGAVLAWYRGRIEFGPRALGHRSILADPRRPEMRGRVNALVKMRESFRPFAPAVSLEQASEYFDVPPGAELPYMNVNAMVRPQYRELLPATTHVDGSSRLQTVSRADNPEFWTLLRALGQRIGHEIVLNTSFNVRGQPIVNTPAEALDTFLSTGIDVLFLENVLVRRRDSKP